jgi:hypothetical protein
MLPRKEVVCKYCGHKARIIYVPNRYKWKCTVCCKENIIEEDK